MPRCSRPEPPEVDAGVAGRSARQEHERRAAKREAAVRGRWGDRIGGVVLALTDEPQSTRAWAVGARGEEKLAEALDGFTVLHDRRVPGTRGNIDHVVVAPAGVFVVDAKRYEGRIEIRNHGWFLRPDERLHVGRRDCSALADGMGWQVAAVEKALLAAGVEPLPPVTPVLCFIDGDWPLISPPDVFRGVRLEGPEVAPQAAGRRCPRRGRHRAAGADPRRGAAGEVGRRAARVNQGRRLLPCFAVAPAERWPTGAIGMRGSGAGLNQPGMRSCSCLARRESAASSPVDAL